MDVDNDLALKQSEIGRSDEAEALQREAQAFFFGRRGTCLQSDKARVTQIVPEKAAAYEESEDWNDDLMP